MEINMKDIRTVELFDLNNEKRRGLIYNRLGNTNKFICLYYDTSFIGSNNYCYICGDYLTDEDMEHHECGFEIFEEEEIINMINTIYDDENPVFGIIINGETILDIQSDHA